MFGRPLRAAGLATIAWAFAGLGRGGPPPASAEESDTRPEIAVVSTDPSGEASSLRMDALDALADDPVDAFEPIARLHDEHASVLLPEPSSEPGPPELHLPGREIAEALWAMLPPAVRARAEERWGPSAA